MIALQVLADTLNNKEILTSSSPSVFSFTAILDYAYKIAMVFIAIFNALFAIYIYISKNKKDNKIKEADRKIALLKTLILDYNLKIFYDSFYCLESTLLELKGHECDKNKIEKDIQTDFRKLNEQFIVFLEAVDMKLYKSMLEVCDNCRDKIVGNIGDEGVNLWVEKQYNDLIKEPLRDVKREMLSQLFSYKGE